MKHLLGFLKVYGITFFLILTVWVNFSACNGGATDTLGNLTPGGSGSGSGSGTGSGSGSGTGSGSGSTQTPGAFDGVGKEEDLWVSVYRPLMPSAHVRNMTGFSTPCEVSGSTTANQDIKCIIDVPEADLVEKNLALQLHTPKEMCAYIGHEPYWFHNHQIGKGPGFLQLNTYHNISKDPSGTVTSDRWAAKPKCSYGVSSAGASALADCDPVVPAREFKFDYSSADGSLSNLKCIYNQTDGPSNSNCCYGDVDFSRYVITEIGQNGASTTTSAPAFDIADFDSWNSNLRACVGGPGRSDWPYVDNKTTLPAYHVENGYEGATFQYKYKALGEIVPQIYQAPSQYPYFAAHFANYYTTGLHTHGAFNSVSTTTIPYFINPIDDIEGGGLDQTAVGNEAYTWHCYDTNFEIKHRIRVYIRDWDSRADYVSYITSKGVSETWSRAGVLSSPVSVTCPGLGGECNNFWGIDDMVNPINTSAPYTTYGYPAMGLINTSLGGNKNFDYRDKYYPHLPYNQ